MHSRVCPELCRCTTIEQSSLCNLVRLFPISNILQECSVPIRQMWHRSNSYTELFSKQFFYADWMQYLIKSGMQMDTFFRDVENKHDTSRAFECE